MLEIVNERGQIIGVAPRSEIHGNPALMHRVVHVVVLDKDGNILLQKRSMKKDVAPGRWDTSVGGHVDPDEGLKDAALREMFEELGVRLELEFMYRYIHSNPYETEMVHTYRAFWDENAKEKLSCNPDEIDELKFWSIEDIKSVLKNETLSDNFKDEFEKYLAWRERE